LTFITMVFTTIDISIVFNVLVQQLRKLTTATQK